MNIDDSSCDQCLDATNFSNGDAVANPNSYKSDVYKQLELIVPLYLSGLLYQDNVLPNIALRGLRVKIELNNIETIMQIVTAPLYKLDAGQHVKMLLLVSMAVVTATPQVTQHTEQMLTDRLFSIWRMPTAIPMVHGVR